MCEVVTDLDRDWLNQTDVTIRLKVKNRREFQNCHIGFHDDGWVFVTWITNIWETCKTSVANLLHTIIRSNMWWGFLWWHCYTFVIANLCNHLQCFFREWVHITPGKFTTLSSQSRVRATVERGSKCVLKGEIALNLKAFQQKPKDLKYVRVKIKVHNFKDFLSTTFLDETFLQFDLVSLWLLPLYFLHLLTAFRS